MNKYLILIKAQLGQISSYRFELVWGWIYRIISAVVYIALWSLSAENQDQSDKIISYFLLYHMLLNPLSTGKLARWISNAVHSGEVSNYLIKPISFPLVQLIRLISAIFARMAVPIIMLVVATLLWPQIFGPASLSHLVLFIVSVLLSIVLWQNIMLILGSIAFWGTEVHHFEVVIHLSLSIFKGAFIPAYLFSQQLQSALLTTPIPYLASFPIGIYQGDYSLEQITQGLVIALLWTLAFIVIFRFVYSKGLQNYDALGG